jgi:hypothetical protein
MALFRTFQSFRETQKLEARFEAFNVTSSLRPGDPNTVFGASGFGQILSAADPRLMQFSSKYISDKMVVKADHSESNAGE